MRRKFVAILLSLLMVLSGYPVSFANPAYGMETAQSQAANTNPEYVLSILVSFGLPIEPEIKEDGTEKSYQFQTPEAARQLAPLIYVQLTQEEIERYSAIWEELGGSVSDSEPKVYHVLFKALELNGLNLGETFEIADDTISHLFGTPTAGSEADSLLESVTSEGKKQFAYYQISPLRVIKGDANYSKLIEEEPFVDFLDDSVEILRFMWQGAVVTQMEDDSLDNAKTSAQNALAQNAYYYATTIRTEDSGTEQDVAKISYQKGMQKIKLFPHSVAFQDTTNTSTESAVSMDPRSFTDDSKIVQHIYKWEESGKLTELSSGEAASFVLGTYRPSAATDANHADNHLELIINSDALQPGRYLYTFGYGDAIDQSLIGTRVSDPLVIDVVDTRPSRKPIEEALAKAPNPETDKEYYHEGDSFGPFGYLGQGGSWWAEYLRVREEVEQAQYKEESQVLEAVGRVEKAVKALIPLASVNASSLYERLQELEDKYADENAFDPDLLRELKSAVEDYRDFAESLYDSEGNPSSKNNQSSLYAMSAMFNHLAELEKKLDTTPVAPPENISLEAIAGMRFMLANHDYETMSKDAYQEGWEVFVEASKHAKHVLEVNGEYSKDLTPEKQKEQVDAFLALHRAYHKLVEDKESIRVRLIGSDIAKAHDKKKGGDYPDFSCDKTLTIPSGTTIEDILNQNKLTLDVEGISVLWGGPSFKDLHIERTLFLNGMPLATQYEKDAYYQNKKDYVLKDGDVLLVSQYQRKLMPEMSDKQTPQSYWDQPSWVKFVSLNLPHKVMAGEPFIINVAGRAAMFPHYTAELKPYKGATIITTSEADEAGDLKTIPLVVPRGTKTDAEGNVTITLNDDGWYLVNAFGIGIAEGQYAVGTNVLLYVESPELKGRIAEYKQQIRAASKIDSFGEEQYTKDEWVQLNELLDKANREIETAQTLNGARNVYRKVSSEIETFVELREKRNREDFPRFRAILERIPQKQEQLNTSHAALIAELESIYSRFPRAIWEKLTTLEIERYNWLLSVKDALPQAKEYAVHVELVADGVSTEDFKALQNMVTWLQENTTEEGRNEYGAGGKKLAVLYGAHTVETIEGWMKQYIFKKQDRFLEGTDIVFNLSPEYASHFHIRGNRTKDKNGKPYGDNNFKQTIEGDGWSIEDLSTGSGGYNYFNLNAKRKYLINGKEFIQIGYEVVGMDVQSLPRTSYDFFDSSDYKGKSSEAKVEIKDAFCKFTMPSNDVTIRVKWRPVAGTEAEIRAERESAKYLLDQLFQEYQKSKDAYGKNWATLEGIYKKAIQDIGGANDVNVIAALRREAIVAMFAVKKDASDANTPELPDLGESVGRVYVTIENSTYLDGNYAGTIFDGWVELEENDTMMTVVLKALKTKGFSWEGTGNHADAPEGYRITYLANIYQDLNNDGRFNSDSEKGLGEFDGGPRSGWMGTLNDWYTNEGFQAFGVKNGKLVSGDEIHILYTRELGRDIGGSWGNSDTSLKSLEVSGGRLAPSFDGSITDYVLTIRSDKATVTVTPEAANKNYLVRIFLNHYNSDASHYRRKDQIPVKVGDAIYVGCGDKSWPSMNKQGNEATPYNGTTYKIHVVRADAAGLQIRIDALKEVRFSNYKRMKAVITELLADYEALADKSKVDVTKLMAAKSRIEGFEEVERVKALLAAIPSKSKLTTGDKAKVEMAWKAYEALKSKGEGLEKYITYADTLKYNDAIAWLKSQRVDLGSTQTIEGSKQPPVETSETIVSTVIENGSVKAEVSKTVFAEVLKNNTELVLTAEIPQGAKQLNLTLPTKELKQYAEGSKAGLSVETNVGELSISSEALKTIVGAGTEPVEIVMNSVPGKDLNVRPDATVLEVKIKVGDINITKFGGKLEILLPVDNTKYREGKDYKVTIISSDGTVSKEKAKVTKENDKGTNVRVLTDHLSTFIVTPERALHFVDIEGSWAEQDIAYVYDAGIMSGTAELRFSPNMKLTRAMFVAMLYRLAGSPSLDVIADAANTTKFADVEAQSWYTDAVEWARRKGIASGVGNQKFAPHQEITREQMIAFLYRYVRDNAGAADVTVLSDYTDVNDVSDWAKSMMAWAVENRVVQGTETKALLPGANASRAEAAAVMTRFIQNWTKK